MAAHGIGTSTSTIENFEKWQSSQIVTARSFWWASQRKNKKECGTQLHQNSEIVFLPKLKVRCCMTWVTSPSQTSPSGLPCSIWFLSLWRCCERDHHQSRSHYTCWFEFREKKKSFLYGPNTWRSCLSVKGNHPQARVPFNLVFKQSTPKLKVDKQALRGTQTSKVWKALIYIISICPSYTPT